jgi:hypothetical protein
MGVDPPAAILFDHGHADTGKVQRGYGQNQE